MYVYDFSYFMFLQPEISSEKGTQARNEILPVYICCHLVVMLLYDMVWILFWLYCE